jgi:hypothetical protein
MNAPITIGMEPEDFGQTAFLRHASLETRVGWTQKDGMEN